MSEQKHVIKRQVIELELTNLADARRIQTEVSRDYREQIVPLLDRYCS